MADSDFPITPLEPPEDFTPGLIPDPSDSRVAAAHVLPGDAGFPIIPASQRPNWIKANVGLDLDVQSVFNQGSVGSCAAEGVVGGVSLVRACVGLPHVEFNPYGTYHTSSGGSDRGSTLGENLSLVSTIGCHPASLHPRSLGFRTRPSSASYGAAKSYRILRFIEVKSWDEFSSALCYRWPVFWGYTGHAILAVKLLSPGRFKYLNSWGANWGDSGFGISDQSRIRWEYRAFALMDVVYPLSDIPKDPLSDIPKRGFTLLTNFG